MRNSNNMIFYIKPISDNHIAAMEILNPIISTELYVGVDTHQREDVITVSSVNYEYLVSEDKKKYILERLKDKIILFKPKINIGQNDLIYKNIEIISLEAIDEKFEIHFICL